MIPIFLETILYYKSRHLRGNYFNKSRIDLSTSNESVYSEDIVTLDTSNDDSLQIEMSVQLISSLVSLDTCSIIHESNLQPFEQHVIRTQV